MKNTGAWQGGFKRAIGDESLGPTLALALDNTTKQIHICDIEDVGTDWGKSNDSYPTVYIHDITAPITDYVRIYHNGTSGIIDCDGTTILAMTATTLAITADVTLTGDLALATEDISVAQGKYIYLEGQGSTTYIRAANAGYLDLEAATQIRVGVAMAIGAAGAGHRVDFYGDTSGSSMVWADTENKLYFIGLANIHSVGSGMLNWTGDVGIGTSLTVGGNCSFQGATVGINNSITIGANCVVGGNIELTGTMRGVGTARFDSTMRIDGVLSCNDSTDATDTTTGSIQTDGGIACVKQVYCGTGITMPAAANYSVLTVGSTANVTGSGVLIDDDDRTIYVCADDNSLGGSAATTLNIARFRMLLLDGPFSGEQYALHGTVKYVGASMGSFGAGVFGTAEWSTSMQIDGYQAGVTARVGGSGTTTVNGYLAGMMSVINLGVAQGGSGKSCAFLAYQASTYNWDVGLCILASAVDTGIEIALCTTAISLTGANTTGISISGTYATASSKAINSAITVNVPNYTDGYGANNFDLTTTGQMAGHSAATSSWININGTIASGGVIVAAQTNGIWVNTGSSGDISNAEAVIGMRMSAITTGNAANLYLWSVNVSGDTLDALFHVAAAVTNLGATSIATTNGSKIANVPLYKEGGSTVGYLRVYDVADIS